ncbi:cell division protein FtsL [Oenococcus alcoholitolerans]|uniref:Cell division protein FtsL n=1 Tax=Oenococcus alcoholitolerans TaxID=931074 RepID=A0ABR4XPB4_9LACO|nr:cell division protein FtsL [Oenococcus alcoholitolerans]
MAQNAVSTTYRKKINSKTTVLPKKKSKTAVRYKRAAWSLQDFTFAFIVAIVVGAVMFFSLLISNRTSSIDDQLQSKNKQIQSITNDNEKTREKINQLTSITALQSFAAKNNMQMNSGNIQNIKNK